MSEPMTPERFEEFRACHLFGLTERHAKELFAEADRLRAELDRLEGEKADFSLVRERHQEELDRLRAGLRALAERHGWQPELGPCVCDEHKQAAALLAEAR